MTAKLAGFLRGERDGSAKDGKYIFRLHLSLQDFKAAADSAIEMAIVEQQAGRYKQAHDILFECYKVLRESGERIPQNLYKMLLLAHSYSLVKPLIKMDDHDRGARMLIRVAKNISQFPARKLIVVIL